MEKGVNKKRFFHFCLISVPFLYAFCTPPVEKKELKTKKNRLSKGGLLDKNFN
jgi:hypothetical protein